MILSGLRLSGDLFPPQYPRWHPPAPQRSLPHVAVENIIEQVILLCQVAQQSYGLHLNKGNSKTREGR